MIFRQFHPIIANERGSVLNIALLILMILTLAGIYLSQSTTTSVKIAGNEKSYQNMFYTADSGVDLAAELVEQNVACPNGFTEDGVGLGKTINNTIKVEDGHLFFWQNAQVLRPTDANRDAYLPVGATVNDPRTNFTFGGATVWSKGGAIQMAAGYEGKGKSAASGGGHILYDIYSQRYGTGSQPLIIRIQWRHMIGSEGTCIYG